MKKKVNNIINNLNINAEAVSLFSRSDLNYVTLIKWDLFRIWYSKNKLVEWNTELDYEYLNLQLNKEKAIIEVLMNAGLKIKYVRLVPDDIFSIFWEDSDISDFNISTFVEDTKKYMYINLIDVDVSVIKFSTLLEDRLISKVYKEVYVKVYSDIFNEREFYNISKKDISREIAMRKKIYNPYKLFINNNVAKDFARRAFAVFAAETSVIESLKEKGIFENPVILQKFNFTEVDKYKIYYKIKGKNSTFPKIYL